MLLDTCNNKLSDGRYDIIVHSPIAKIAQQSSGVSVDITAADMEWDKRLVASTKDCVFDLLTEVHDSFRAQINTHVLDTHPEFNKLPFLCGALGYFSYDLNTRLNTSHIDDIHPEQYASADASIGIYDQSLIFDNRTGKVFCCYLNEKRRKLLVVDHCQKSSSKAKRAFQLTQKWTANLSENEYTEQLTKVDEYIRAGDCYQINFAQRFSAKYSGSEWLAYEMLRSVNKAPFSSFIRLDKSCILSVSPERFLQVKNGIVETKPIKGTRKRAAETQADKALSDELLASEKDKAENLMIVDLLRNDLSKHCKPHSVTVPKLFSLESYPAVHHMVSTVLGELKENVSPIALLKGAFPGGSITGAPKVRAMQIIQELEPDKRSIYCGSIGYIGVRNDMDTNICIRTILAENDTLYCWAGGGIVLDSDISSEYQESLDKVARILPVLEESLKSDRS
ncbi:aminodeoxychorismate synthase component I [Glaciecola sp. MH2013]|nr:aminodeoxychorismate synthase component I [Glaciecola sp. MH2013]